jgi:hypothetical protein
LKLIIKKKFNLSLNKAMSLSPDELKKLKALPIMKELKKAYDSQQGAGRKMKGKGFWQNVGNWFKQAAVDVDAWAKKAKPLSTLSKAAGLLGMIPGLQELVPIAAGIKGVSEFTGYGKKMKGGRKGLTANDFGSHVNAVAGRRGLVKQGMGSFTQDHQSQVYRALGTGTFPSHLQPFLTAGKIKGGSAGLAVGSIGNAVKPKF